MGYYSLFIDRSQAPRGENKASGYGAAFDLSADIVCAVCIAVQWRQMVCISPSKKAVWRYMVISPPPP